MVDCPSEEEWAMLSPRTQEIGRFAFGHPELTAADLARTFAMRPQGINWQFGKMLEVGIVAPQKANPRRGRRFTGSPLVAKEPPDRLSLAEAWLEDYKQLVLVIEKLRADAKRIPELEMEVARYKNGEEKWRKEAIKLKQGGVPGIAHMDSDPFFTSHNIYPSDLFNIAIAYHNIAKEAQWGQKYPIVAIEPLCYTNATLCMG